MKRNKIAAMLLGMAVVTGVVTPLVMPATTTYAAAATEQVIGHGEWRQENGKWYYYQDGKMLKNCWVKDGIDWYMLNEDGTMSRLPELRQMADKYNLKLISIRDLIAYRLKQESIVEKGVEVDMPTAHGHFRLIPFRQKSNGLEHVALFKGTWADNEPILVRVHSSCATGDIFGSMRCDCGDQLHKAMEMIDQAGKGVVVYLNQEGRGIGLMEKMKAYKLQEDGMDTVDANICLGHLADERDYGVGAQILRELGVHKMRLMTNNPVKRVGLEAYGLEIVENVPIEVTPNPYNERYLRTKKERMGHTLHFNK